MQNYILLLIILFLGCSEKRTAQIADIRIETINFSSLKEEHSPFPDSLIMHKRYINISTNNKELLFSNINQIEIKDNYIYILDSYIRILAVFDLDGNAIGRVGNIGRAPGEYLNADSFSIDSLGRIYIIDGQQDKLNVYDNSFNSLYSKKLPFEIDILHCLPDGKFLTGLCSWNKMENAKDKITLTDSNLMTQKYFVSMINT